MLSSSCLPVAAAAVVLPQPGVSRPAVDCAVVTVARGCGRSPDLKAEATRHRSMLAFGARRALGGIALFLLVMVPAAARAQTEVVEYYATDALGSIRVVFDANGLELARADYLPFGEELASSSGLPPERFTGQARDGELGQDYFMRGCTSRALDGSLPQM